MPVTADFPTDDPMTGLGWPESLPEAFADQAAKDADVSRETSGEVATGLGWPA